MLPSSTTSATRREAERALQEVEPVLLGLRGCTGSRARTCRRPARSRPARRCTPGDRRRSPRGIATDCQLLAAASRSPARSSAADERDEGRSDAAPEMTRPPPCCPGARSRKTSRSVRPAGALRRRTTSLSRRCTSVPVVAVEASNVACACRVDRALSWSTWSSRASNSPSAIRALTYAPTSVSATRPMASVDVMTRTCRDDRHARDHARTRRRDRARSSRQAPLTRTTARS